MEEQENTPAKKGEGAFWRKCPICVRNNATSPEFKEFLSLIEHMETHLQAEPQPVRRKPGAYLTEADLLAFMHGWEILEVPRRRIAPKAQVLLIPVADWLQEALATCPEINDILTSNLKVADQLVDLVGKLPEQFAEQRAYFLKYQDRLKETGMDPKWLRRPGGQVTFVAESMAGAKWGLSPSSSREYVRQVQPKKKSTSPTLAMRAGLTDDLVKERTWWKPNTPDES
jgi:hypothetical protein